MRAAVPNHPRVYTDAVRSESSPSGFESLTMHGLFGLQHYTSWGIPGGRSSTDRRPPTAGDPWLSYSGGLVTDALRVVRYASLPTESCTMPVRDTDTDIPVTKAIGAPASETRNVITLS